MSGTTPRFDGAYLDRKRQQLTQLRDKLRESANAAEAAENEVRLASNSVSGEYEDDAQRLDALETEGHIVAHDAERLAHVERALEKISEGTYGFSDLSGHRIPDDRLEAVPEAILTAAEQKDTE